MKRKSEYAEYVRNRGSSLVMGTQRVPILVTRSNTAGNAVKRSGLIIFFHFLFLAVLHPLYLSFCDCAIREHPGAARPLSPLGRVHRTLHPFALRSLTSTAFHDSVLHFLFHIFLLFPYDYPIAIFPQTCYHVLIPPRIILTPVPPAERLSL